MSTTRRLPPIWLMGLTNLPFGLTAGFCLVPVPEMLAAQGISGGQIAAITSGILSPAFWAFAFSPMLDVRLSRRSYALLFGTLAAISVAFTVLHHERPALVEAVMIAGVVFAMMYQGAVGGWMGSLIDRSQDGKLGTWFAVATTGAYGLMMLLAGEVVHRFSPMVAASLMAAFVAGPMLLFLAVPAPGPDRLLARESFGRFWREVGLMLKQRDVVIALALFMLPAASFALTDVLGGWGKDFAASEHTVSLFAGAGSVAAGLAGSFALYPLSRRFALRPLYLGVGVAGALFTVSLLLLPRTPWAFAVVITGENLFQALSFAASNAITFEVIGPENPLAATIFTVLVAATNLPIVYMTFLDGRGYNSGGISGSYLTDAGISIAACLLLAFVLRRWRATPQTATAALAAVPESAE
ncbi:MAG: MFS transporter [Terracidiphilus sp.]